MRGLSALEKSLCSLRPSRAEIIKVEVYKYRVNAPGIRRLRSQAGVSEQKQSMIASEGLPRRPFPLAMMGSARQALPCLDVWALGAHAKDVGLRLLRSA